MDRNFNRSTGRVDITKKLFCKGSTYLYEKKYSVDNCYSHCFKLFYSDSLKHKYLILAIVAKYASVVFKFSQKVIKKINSLDRNIDPA